MTRTLLILLLLFSASVSLAQPKVIYPPKLHDIDGKEFAFSTLHQFKGTVFIFMLADCPACENYSLTLNKLHSYYQSRGITFIGIFSGNYGTVEEMKMFRKNYKINFPLLQDPEKRLLHALKASVAPQAFLVDSTSTIRYQGRIDDWMYALGKKRTVIRQHDLKNALEQYINGTPIKTAVTTPIGCIIE